MNSMSSASRWALRVTADALAALPELQRRVRPGYADLVDDPASLATQPGLEHPLASPLECAACHGDYDREHDIEAHPTWSGSMMVSTDVRYPVTGNRMHAPP